MTAILCKFQKSFFFSLTDVDTLDSALSSSELHSQGTQSFLLVGGSNKRIFPQRTSKKDETLPYTMKDVDPDVTSCANVRCTAVGQTLWQILLCSLF